MALCFKKIAVVGAGAMGHGIALVCARGGLSVTLVDVNPEVLHAARQKMCAAMKQLAATGLAPSETVAQVLANVQYARSMEEGVRGADLIFEAVPEKKSLKEKVYAQLNAICGPDTVFASNTSGIPINTLASMTLRPERFVGTHFFMPAHLIPLVEVVRGESTLPEVIEGVMGLLRSLGKKTVQVSRDVPGFIANRLQHALAREAMSLVEKGVASAEDVDTVVKNSLAVRLLFTGPMEQRDFNGLDTHLAIAEYLYKDLEASAAPLPILRSRVAAGDYGIKTGRGFFDWADKDISAVFNSKNERLIAVLKLLQMYDQE